MNRIPSIATIQQRFVSGHAPDKDAETRLNDTLCDDCQQPPETGVPTKLAALLAQRQAAREASFPSTLAPGLIVRISPDADDATPGAPTEPLAVLLDRETSPGQWRGWLVGRDTEYASSWDLILGPEEDPRDPQSQVVQIWNVTTIAADRADRVLAQLSADRLAAARAMERDLATNAPLQGIPDTRMGVRLARELSDGTGVVTGTPIGDPDDPRHTYQDIYRQAAEWVSQPARPTPTTSKWSFGRWLSELLMGHWQPAVAFALVAVIASSIFWVQFKDAAIPPEPSENRYIAGAGIQQLVVAHPADTARTIEDSLRALGVAPEIRYETGGSIAIQADLSALNNEQRSRLFAEFNLQSPGESRLSILLMKDTR